MDQSNWKRNVEQRIEYWREQRVKKMAARLQLHSNKPRTISSSILGCGNNRQQIIVPPCRRHSRVNHLWNSNYHSGFRENNLIHKQYHHADQREYRLFSQNGKKVFFGSQKSLYKERKSIHMPKRKYSSCDNINHSGTGAENQNVLHFSESSEPVGCSATADVATDVRSLGCLSDANEKYLLESHQIVDNCSVQVTENISTSSMIDSNLELNGNISSHLQVKYLDVGSNILNVETSYDNVLSKQPTKSHGYLFSEQENSNVTDEKLSAASNVRNSEECLTSGSHVSSDGRSTTLAFEATCKRTDGTAENILKVEEISSELIPSLANGSIADKFSESEISFSYDPLAKVVKDSTVEPIIYAYSTSELNPETAAQSEPNVKCVEEDASVINVVKTGITKEIENVENRFANISIVHKDDLCRDSECKTPMKRERKYVLMDATNIFPSSTIKYAVREIRKNNELEAVVTPVRRSLRISSVTPISSKNMCVESLKDLSPHVLQKIKFFPNPAIYDPPDC